MCNQRLSELEKLFILGMTTTRGCPSSLDSFHRVGYFPLSHSHAFFPCRASATLVRQGHHTRPPGVVITPPSTYTIPSCPRFKPRSPALNLALKKLRLSMLIVLKATAVSFEVCPSVSSANCLSPSMLVVSYVLKSGGLPHGLDNGAKDAATTDLLK